MTNPAGQAEHILVWLQEVSASQVEVVIFNLVPAKHEKQLSGLVEVHVAQISLHLMLHWVLLAARTNPLAQLVQTVAEVHLSQLLKHFVHLLMFLASMVS